MNCSCLCVCVSSNLHWRKDFVLFTKYLILSSSHCLFVTSIRSFLFGPPWPTYQTKYGNPPIHLFSPLSLISAASCAVSVGKDGEEKMVGKYEQKMFWLYMKNDLRLLNVTMYTRGTTSCHWALTTKQIIPSVSIQGTLQPVNITD